MEQSILTSVKKLLGITEECTDFDTDIIMHINTILIILNRIGVGPEGGYLIEDKSQLWSDFLDYEPLLEPVKTLVYLRVRMLFDPPSSGSVTESTKNLISELEWRITEIIESRDFCRRNEEVLYVGV